MGVASKAILAQPQMAVVTNELFTTIGDHITMTDLSAAVVISAGALGVDATAYDVVDKVIIQADTQNVRLTYSDGSTPTATSGFLIRTTDDPKLFTLIEGFVLKAIETAGGAILQVQFGT